MFHNRQLMAKFDIFMDTMKYLKILLYGIRAGKQHTVRVHAFYYLRSD